MTMKEFIAEYGRKGAGLVIRQAVAASQVGEKLDTDTQADLLLLSRKLDELFSSEG
jgi:hypothetical protein